MTVHEQPHAVIADEELAGHDGACAAVLVERGVVLREVHRDARELVVDLGERRIGPPAPIHIEIEVVVVAEFLRYERAGDEDVLRRMC
jgi:hypothetical protein